MKRSLTTIAGAWAVLALAFGCGTQTPPATQNPKSARDDGKPAAEKKPMAVAEPDYWKGKTDLIGAPAPLPPKALALPPIARKRLKNGLSVLMVRDARVPLVTVKLLLDVGAIDDPANKVGLADFTAQMLRQGVRGQSAEQIARAVDSVGTSLGINPGHEVTSIVCDGRADSLDLCLRLISQLVSEPTFPQKEMAEVRDGLLGEVKQQRDDPNMLVAQHFYNQLYGDDHPAGRPTTTSSVKAIKRADLVAFHRRYYTAKNAVLVISGAFEPQKLATKLAAFGRIRGHKRPARQVKKLAQPTLGLHVLLVDKPDLTQSFLMLGHAGVSYRDPDREALRMANYVLGGGGFSSRLMKEVRSRGGKTYGVSSAFYAHRADGVFRIRCSTQNEQLVSTLALIRRELARIIKDPPTAAEMAEAKGRLAGGYTIRFKTGGQLASSLAMAQLRGFDDRFVTEFPLRISRLDEPTVAQAARRHIFPKQLLLVIVGRAAVVAPQLERAKIAFDRISYLEPIGARARAKERAGVTVSKAEQRAGQRLLKRAQKAIGGVALAALKRLRIRGRMQRGPMQTRFESAWALPDKMRLSFVLDMTDRGLKPMAIVQILSGKKAVMIAGPNKRPLPPHQQVSLRDALFRQVAFVLTNVQKKGVALRPTKVELKRGQVGVDAFPKQSRPLTLIFDRKTFRLVELRHRSRDGSWRASVYSDYRRVGKVWLPHRSRSGSGKTKQEVVVDKFELNPALPAKLFAID